MRVSPLLLCLALSACGADPGRTTREATPPPRSETSSPVPASSVAEASQPAAEIPPTPTPAPEQIAYDLMSHLERAQLSDAAGELWNFDGARDGALTLGGFRTRLRSAQVDGVRVALSSGRRATLLLPWDGRGEPRVEISVRAFRGGPTVFRLGELELTAQLPTDGRYVTVVLEAGENLRPGLNTLTITTRRSGRWQGQRAGFAIDWLRVGAGPRGEVPRLRDARLELPAGSSTRWVLRCPVRSRLALRTPAGSSVRASLKTEDGAPRVLPLSPGPEGALTADLACAGDLVELTLSAEQPATLSEARVMVPRQGEEAAAPPPLKNVLVYLIDTLRADHLRAYAPETRVETPGLTRFLRGASVFSEAHAQENWTKPSVATLLSSLFPWQHTATEGDSVVPRSVRLLPEMLHARGFRTAAFIANGYVSDRFGFGRGWDDYRNYIREGRRTKAQYVAHDVLSWLDAHAADGRFFLYVHTIDPHVPYRPPASFLERYGDASYRGPVDFRHDSTLLEHVKTGAVSFGAADRRQLEALYDAEISYHDVYFDRIMDGLARRGLADDTLVVVTADHGEEFWDHGSVGHGHSLYEELLHVPLFVRWPGLGSPRRVPGPAGLVDVVPTIFEALGEQTPPGLSGRSLGARLRGLSPDAPGVVLSGFFNNQRAAVVDGLKVTFRRADRIALFDLTQDPGETHDISRERPMALIYALSALGRGLAESAASRSTGRRQRATPSAEHTQIDPEMAAQLRALGYVGTP
ncbi:MAG: sulfatase [Deltaproteobacteria bacterium]|nr:sulfatase [Deltaproteobacteria bacterium]